MGKGYHTEDQVCRLVHYRRSGEALGKDGRVLGWTMGMLVGAAFFMIPGIGPVMVAGSLVAWIVGALESAVVVGGLSALGAALYSLGVPKDSALKYETSIKAGKYSLIAHGTPEEVENARRILLNTGAEEMGVHRPDRPVAAA